MDTQERFVAAMESADSAAIIEMIEGREFDPHQLRFGDAGSLLHMAAQLDMFPLVQFLIQDCGWSVNHSVVDGPAYGIDKVTPLDWAVKNGAWNVVAHLKGAGGECCYDKIGPNEAASWDDEPNVVLYITSRWRARA